MLSSGELRCLDGMPVWYCWLRGIVPKGECGALWHCWLPAAVSLKALEDAIAAPPRAAADAAPPSSAPMRSLRRYGGVVYRENVAKKSDWYVFSIDQITRALAGNHSSSHGNGR